MKKMNVFAAAFCTAVVIAAPNLKQELHAESYGCEVEPPIELGSEVYKIEQALLQETVKVAGCAAIPKRVVNKNITFYDSNIAIIEYSDSLSLRANWAQVKNGIINISITPESEQDLYDLYSTQGLAACQSKFPTATQGGSGVVDASVLTTASSFKVNGAQKATAKIQMKGLYLNDGKKDKANQSTAANLTVSLSIKGDITLPQ